MSRFVYESLPGHSAGLSILQDNEQIATARICFEIGKPAAVIATDGYVVVYTIDLISNKIDEAHCVQEFLNDHIQHENHNRVEILAAGRTSIIRKGSSLFACVGGTIISSLSTHPFSTEWVVEDTARDGTYNYYLDVIHERLLTNRFTMTALIKATMSLRKYYAATEDRMRLSTAN